MVRVWVEIFFFQAEDGIRASPVPGVQTCALPILSRMGRLGPPRSPGVSRMGRLGPPRSSGVSRMGRLAPPRSPRVSRMGRLGPPGTPAQFAGGVEDGPSRPAEAAECSRAEGQRRNASTTGWRSHAGKQLRNLRATAESLIYIYIYIYIYMYIY